MDSGTRELLAVGGFAVFAVVFVAGVFLVAGYPAYAQGSANEQACQGEYGANATVIAETYDDERIVCRHDAGVTVLDEPPARPVLDWSTFRDYVDAVLAGEA